jgi:hypothetical protein
MVTERRKIEPSASPSRRLRHPGGWPVRSAPKYLAKRIYRSFAEKVELEDLRRLKSVASIDAIVSFLPPGGSRVKG